MEEDETKKGVKFYINNCPNDTFARFHKFCEETSSESGLTWASYPLGLKQLLDKVCPIGADEEVKEESKSNTFGGSV